MSTPASIHAFPRTRARRTPSCPSAHTSRAWWDVAGRSLPAKGWAKVVICVADGEPIQAVIPAPLIVNLDWLSALAGASSMRFALNEESQTWFSDCEPGAMPPWSAHGQRAFVDSALTAEFDVVFHAGTHRQAIRNAGHGSCGSDTADHRPVCRTARFQQAQSRNGPANCELASDSFSRDLARVARERLSFDNHLSGIGTA